MSTRQLAMVMDLNKCLGCQTCTVACKTQWTNRNGREYMYWNNVETRPGAGPLVGTEAAAKAPGTVLAKGRWSGASPSQS